MHIGTKNFGDRMEPSDSPGGVGYEGRCLRFVDPLHLLDAETI